MTPLRIGGHVIGGLTGISRIGGPRLGWKLWAPCASWSSISANRYTGPWNAITENPILLIGTRFDPNTPFVNALVAAQRLGNAVLLTHLGYGHLSTQDFSSCIEHARSADLVDLIIPPRGTICQSDRLPFDPDFGKQLP